MLKRAPRTTALPGLITLALVTALSACNGGISGDCGLGTTGDSGGSEAPWIEVYNGESALADGQAIELIFGGQGSCMFELQPYVGGFIPESDYSEIEVTLDIEGVAPGPGGHFYSFTHSTFLGCEDPDRALPGGADPYPSTIQMIVDETALVDGNIGHIEFTLQTPDGRSAAVAADVTIKTSGCSGYGSAP